MSSAPNAHAVQRELLLERCQRERNELIVMAATAHALLPRPRTWTQAVRTFCRLLRLLVARTRRANQRSGT